MSRDELILLGGAIAAAQRVEFWLAGLAAHVPQDHECRQSDRRLNGLTPEAFLRGDPSNLRVTLGQLMAVFGEAFVLTGPEVDEFVRDRNLIAHNYYRLFHAEIRGVEKRTDGEVFLTRFIQRACQLERLLVGLAAIARSSRADQEGDPARAKLSPYDRQCMKEYADWAGPALLARASETGRRN